uniref:Uncharacterized protein n=1 Tax=Polytomella parva TaxID=51329 RepID=A0A7S0VEA6_9CHLO|mmetsp:Transcript_34104/g.61488  ORF Transcript_34104/g.61488 Transcript_34104/m.61488 type:complete len:246 (+) Transcript_34104:75-812(+)
MGCSVSRPLSKVPVVVQEIEIKSPQIDSTSEEMGFLDTFHLGKSERPRSAMKQPTVEANHNDNAVHRLSGSNNSFSRKVSFKVKTGNTGEHHINLKKSDDVSMKKLVDILYSRVLSDERLNHFYVGVDMQKLKGQQEALLLLVFGGQELLEDSRPGFFSSDMRKIHLRLIHDGLSFEHFDMFAQHFKETLDSVPGFPEESKVSALSYLTKTRNQFRPLEPGEWPPTGVCPGSGAMGGTCPVVRGA